MIRFIDRKDELRLLEEEWSSARAKLIILYGRRRIGKTRLIKEFIKDKKGIFYIAEDMKKELIIEDLKKEISKFFNDEFLGQLKIENWNILFEYLCRIVPKNERFYFVIDEFSYIIKNSPEVLSILQKYWDLYLSKTKIFIILSGSLLGLMNQTLNSSSPLYGRRSRDIQLRKLPFKYSREFLKMDLENSLKTYFSIDGVPEYLIKASEYENFETFVKKEFFNKYGYFYNEPYFLLGQGFKELRTYFSMVNALAYGHTEPTRIANFVGLRTREIYPYLENLIRLGLVKREPNILNPRKGLYLISDKLLDFWFNFVFKYRTFIELEQMDLKTLDFDQYFGKIFESFVKDEIVPVIYGKRFDKIGKWWYKDKEIDILALNEKSKELLAVECKWEDYVEPKKVCRSLLESLGHIQWYKDQRKEYLAIFAKSFKEKIDEYNGLRVHCYDLNDIEKILTQASDSKF